MIPIDRYSYFPVLEYLPLSNCERKVYSLVLTFAGKGERTGKGLCLSNAKIGQAINRSGHTVKKAITTLRQKGLIVADKEKSRHRIIWPGNPEPYLTTLNGQVNDILLDHFRNLLDQYSGHLLDRPGWSTEGRKEKKKEIFSFAGADADADAIFSKLGISSETKAKLNQEGWAV